MPSARIRVDAAVDDILIPSLPLTRRLDFAEVGGNRITLASSGSYQQFPMLSHLGTIQGYIITCDVAFTLRKAGQSDAGEAYNAGGFAVSMDTNITNTGNNGITVLVGATANIRVLAFGQ